MGTPLESRLLEFLQRPGEDSSGGMEGDSGIVIEDVCQDGMQNLAGRIALMLKIAGIFVGELVVVGAGVMVVVAVEVISISEKRCFSVMEVECLGVQFGLVRGDMLKIHPCFKIYLRKLLRLDPGR